MQHGRGGAVQLLAVRAQPGGHSEGERLARPGEHNMDVEVLELQLVGEAQHGGRRRGAGRVRPRPAQLDVRHRQDEQDQEDGRHELHGGERLRVDVGDTQAAAGEDREHREQHHQPRVSEQALRAIPHAADARRVVARHQDQGARLLVLTGRVHVLGRALARRPADDVQDPRDVEERRHRGGTDQRGANCGLTRRHDAADDRDHDVRRVRQPEPRADADGLQRRVASRLLEPLAQVDRGAALGVRPGGPPAVGRQGGGLGHGVHPGRQVRVAPAQLVNPIRR